MRIGLRFCQNFWSKARLKIFLIGSHNKLFAYQSEVNALRAGCLSVNPRLLFSRFPMVGKQKIVLDNHYENIYGPVRTVYTSLRGHFIKIAHGQFALYQLVRHTLLFGKDLEKIESRQKSLEDSCSAVCFSLQKATGRFSPPPLDITTAIVISGS